MKAIKFETKDGTRCIRVSLCCNILRIDANFRMKDEPKFVETMDDVLDLDEIIQGGVAWEMTMLVNLRGRKPSLMCMSAFAVFMDTIVTE